jgi:hypothetical protein
MNPWIVWPQLQIPLAVAPCTYELSRSRSELSADSERHRISRIKLERSGRGARPFLTAASLK